MRPMQPKLTLNPMAYRLQPTAYSQFRHHTPHQSQGDRYERKSHQDPPRSCAHPGSLGSWGEWQGVSTGLNLCTFPTQHAYLQQLMDSGCMATAARRQHEDDGLNRPVL